MSIIVFPFFFFGQDRNPTTTPHTPTGPFFGMSFLPHSPHDRIVYPLKRKHDRHFFMSHATGCLMLFSFVLRILFSGERFLSLELSSCRSCQFSVSFFHAPIGCSFFPPHTPPRLKATYKYASFFMAPTPPPLFFSNLNRPPEPSFFGSFWIRAHAFFPSPDAGCSLEPLMFLLFTSGAEQNFGSFCIVLLSTRHSTAPSQFEDGRAISFPLYLYVTTVSVCAVLAGSFSSHSLDLVFLLALPPAWRSNFFFPRFFFFRGAQFSSYFLSTETLSLVSVFLPVPGSKSIPAFLPGSPASLGCKDTDTTFTTAPVSPLVPIFSWGEPPSFLEDLPSVFLREINYAFYFFFSSKFQCQPIFFFFLSAILSGSGDSFLSTPDLCFSPPDEIRPGDGLFHRRPFSCSPCYEQDRIFTI